MWMCLLTFADETPFQAEASVTAQLNLIHMLDQRRDRKLEVPAIDLSGNATYRAQDKCRHHYSPLGV
jgi:hypothetical protein